MVTHVPVLDVRPQLDGGCAVQAVAGEEFDVRACVFGEGKAIVGAAARNRRDRLDGTVCTLDAVPISDVDPARILEPAYAP